MAARYLKPAITGIIISLSVSAVWWIASCGSFAIKIPSSGDHLKPEAVRGTTLNSTIRLVHLSELPPDDLAAIREVLSSISQRNRPAFARKWGDTFVAEPGELLPTLNSKGAKITYREYYIRKAPSDDSSWGSRRLLVSPGGVAYYTPDHYCTFLQLRDFRVLLPPGSG